MGKLAWGTLQTKGFLEIGGPGFNFFQILLFKGYWGSQNKGVVELGVRGVYKGKFHGRGFKGIGFWLKEGLYKGKVLPFWEATFGWEPLWEAFKFPGQKGGFKTGWRSQGFLGVNPRKFLGGPKEGFLKKGFCRGF